MCNSLTSRMTLEKLLNISGLALAMGMLIIYCTYLSEKCWTPTKCPVIRVPEKSRAADPCALLDPVLTAGNALPPSFGDSQVIPHLELYLS